MKGENVQRSGTESWISLEFEEGTKERGGSGDLGIPTGETGVSESNLKLLFFREIKRVFLIKNAYICMFCWKIGYLFSTFEIEIIQQKYERRDRENEQRVFRR